MRQSILHPRIKLLQQALNYHIITSFPDDFFYQLYDFIKAGTLLYSAQIFIIFNRSLYIHDNHIYSRIKSDNAVARQLRGTMLT